MLDAVGAMAQLLGIELTPHKVMAAMLCVLVILAPAIIRNMRTSHARTVLKESRFVEGDARTALEERVLTIVTGRKNGLVAVIEEAHRMRRNELARRALVQLRELTGPTAQVKRLARLTDPKPLPASPAELGLQVEKLRHAGLHDKAAERLRRGLNRWPHDTWLQDLGGPDSAAVGHADAASSA
jgi:hypothetical protein